MEMETKTRTIKLTLRQLLSVRNVLANRIRLVVREYYHVKGHSEAVRALYWAELETLRETKAALYTLHAGDSIQIECVPTPEPIYPDCPHH